MAGISDDESYVMFPREFDTHSHMASVCSVDRIYGLIAQGAILGRLLTGGDVQDRT